MKKFFSIILISVLSLGYASAQIDTIFYEDFHAGIPAGWTDAGTSNGVANPWAKFRYTHSGSHGAYGSPADSINSPTHYNGWIIFDSDSLDNGGVQGNFGNGPAPAPQTVALTTTAINIAGNPYVQLVFNQYYRNLGSTTSIGISIDNVNWVYDTINANIGQNENTPTNSQVRLDLSPYINGSSVVYIQFAMDAYYYFWQIDDIMLTTLPDNDMKIFKTQDNIQSGTSGLGLFYSSIPASQADSFAAVAFYENGGQLPQPNAEVTFKLAKNGTTIQTDVSTPLPLLTYGIDTPVISNSFYTQGVGSYVLSMNATSDSTDYDPTNNVDSFAFTVNDSIYSVNNGTSVFNAYYLIRTTAGINSPIGVIFEVDQQDTVTSMTTSILGGAGNTQPGSVVQGQIYAVTFDPNAGTLLYNNPQVSTLPRTLASTDMTQGFNGAIKKFSMPIDNSTGNAILAPGLYWATVQAVSTPDSLVLVVSTKDQVNAFPAGQATTGLGLVSTTDAPYVTMNFGHAASLLYASWTRSPGTSPLRVGQPVTFTAQTNASVNATYEWDVTGPNSGTSFQQFGKIVKDTFQVADSFTVCLTVTDGGTSTTPYCKVVVVREDGTGVNDVAPLSQVTMVPNPTTGRVNISADDVNGALTITVINVLGDVVKTYHEETSGAFAKTYNLSDLAGGIYLVKMENAGTTVTKRLSISK